MEALKVNIEFRNLVTLYKKTYRLFHALPEKSSVSLYHIRAIIRIYEEKDDRIDQTTMLFKVM